MIKDTFFNRQQKLVLPDLSNKLGLISPDFVIQDIFQGGMGTCAKIQNADKQFFALKIIHTSLLENETAMQRYIDEMKTWLTLSACSGVVEAFCITRVNDIPCIATQWMDRGSIRPYISQINPEFFYRNIDRIASTLDWAFRNYSIIHRDLKPENILLQNKNSDTDIKIADFGVAREIDTGCKTVIGSLSYIAPEVLQRKDTIKGTGSYGESADMWSVGVITYVILIGGLPFKDEEGMDMYKKVNQLLKFQESYWKSISQTAKDFITQLFQVDPKKRFSAKDCLNHPWISELRTTKTDSASSADDSINTNIIISGSTIEIDDDNKTIETEDENQNENNSSATPNSKKSSRSIQNSPAETRSSKRKKSNSPEKTTIEKGNNNNDNRRKSPRTKPSS